MVRSGPLSLPTETLRLAPGLALLFDLDGVVVDSMPVHQVAWQRYLESIGADAQDIVSRMHGRRSDEIVRDFLGLDADPREVFEHGAAKERLFRELMGERLHHSRGSALVPGIAAFLRRTAGIPVALVT